MANPSRKIRQLLPVLHIYCEGKKTEPNYIRSYIAKNYGGNRLVADAVKVERTTKNTPIQLVEVALKHKNQRDCPSHDQFWVVYDRESVLKYDDELHARALDKAARKGINVAISNVCFELWLLLHFKPNAASFSSYDDLMHRSTLRRELANYGIQNYEKGADIFLELQGLVSTAKMHAQAMNAGAKQVAEKADARPYQLNPFTEIGELLEAIDTFVINNKCV